MWLNKLYRRWVGQPATGTSARAARARRHDPRLTLERLEERALLSDFTAASVLELIAAIDAANQTPEADTITLAAGRTFALTEVNNTTNGPTGLPTIAANSGNLTILGNGDTIERSTATGTPAFRLFDVAVGASLSLQNLTLQGGLAFGAGVSAAQGGAIYNQGSLTLSGVTVQNNIAQGREVFEFPAPYAAGGGIYSSGALTLERSTIQNNQAIGGPGAQGSRGRADCTNSRDGGSAIGGGLYVSGGTVLLTGVTLSGNTAQGGAGGLGFRMPPHTRYCEGGIRGGDGGSGYGGGMYAAGGTITLRNTVVTGNTANGGAGGGNGGKTGLSAGGGLYIESDALVCLDAFTERNVKRNRAQTDPNIAGPYTICS